MHGWADAYRHTPHGKPVELFLRRRLHSASDRDYSASAVPPPIFATSSCFTRSTLNFVALAIILSSASSKSNDVAFENRVKFTRETTNGFRYGLVRPRAFSFST